MDKGLLKNRDYRWWFAADTLGVISGVTRYLAVSLVAFALTGSETRTALLTTITMVAVLIGALPGGVITDGMQRTKLMKLAGLMAFVIYGTIALLLVLGLLEFWSLAALLVIRALTSGMFGSASDAALKSIVDPEDYASAAAANQGRDSVIELTSSPLSGFLYMLGSYVPFLFSALCGLGEAFCASKINEEYQSPPNNGVSFIAKVREGIEYIWHRPLLRLLLIVNGVVTLGFTVGTYSAELFLIARGTSPLLIGILGTGIGASMLLGSAVASALVRRFPTGWLAALALGWIAFWFIPLLIWQSYLTVVIALSAAAVLVASNSRARRIPKPDAWPRVDESANAR